jgi:hypothetical protein
VLLVLLVAAANGEKAAAAAAAASLPLPSVRGERDDDIAGGSGCGGPKRSALSDAGLVTTSLSKSTTTASWARPRKPRTVAEATNIKGGWCCCCPQNAIAGTGRVEEREKRREVQNTGVYKDSKKRETK